MKFKKTTYIILGAIAFCFVLAVALPPVFMHQTDSFSSNESSFKKVTIQVSDTSYVTTTFAPQEKILLNFIPDSILEQVEIIQTNSDSLRIDINKTIKPIIYVDHQTTPQPRIVIEEDIDSISSIYDTDASYIRVIPKTPAPLMVIYVPRSGVQSISVNNQNAVLRGFGPASPAILNARSVSLK